MKWLPMSPGPMRCRVVERIELKVEKRGVDGLSQGERYHRAVLQEFGG